MFIIVRTMGVGCKAIALAGGLLLIGQVAALGQSGTALAKSTDIVVDNQRPLWIALQKVEQLTHLPVNLEDIPYQNANALLSQDIVTKTGMHFRAVSPRGGKLQVSLSEGESACEAAQEVLYAYYRSGLPGSYNTVCREHRVDVIPVSFTDVNGTGRTAIPVMNQPITFPEASRPVAQTFQLIAGHVAKAAGVTVLLGMVPFPENTIVTIGASQEPAESVIARMAPKLRPIAFWLGYDPYMKAYYLNLRLVPLAPTATSNSTPQPGAGPAVRRPAQNPLFVKDH